MKRLLTVSLVTVGVVLMVGMILGAVPSTKGKAVVRGEEYHHLLALDVKEAAEHARTLHHYATVHAAHLDKAVVAKHVEELTKNLEGVRTELADVEKNVEPAETGKGVEINLGAIRTESGKAQTALDELKTEAAKDAPSATVIAEKSRVIYVAMTAAEEHHHKAMVKRGVPEPKKPAKT